MNAWRLVWRKECSLHWSGINLRSRFRELIGVGFQPMPLRGGSTTSAKSRRLLSAKPAKRVRLPQAELCPAQGE
jgi:hypothetical protein